MPRLAVATPGGDAPGMNACLRAVVKHATSHGLDVTGIRNGALGLLRSSREHGDYTPLYSSSLANTINRSGTVLKSSRQSRFEEFVTERSGMRVPPGEDLTRSDVFLDVVGQMARQALEANSVDALLLIGGDTTSRAARAISLAYGGRFPVVVIPATIDNDIRGTSETIGFDSAIAMAVAQVDAIRETASAMDRVFVVEVMGAHRGYIAVAVAIATGAEVVMIPEIDYSAMEIRDIVAGLATRAARDHQSAIAIVAEGVQIADARGTKGLPPGQALISHLEDYAPQVETRLSVLGHILRGAPPTARTRNLAALAGGFAVQEILAQLRAAGTSADADTCKPTLVGIHVDGYLKRVEITGDMIRQEQSKLTRLAHDEVAVLGY